MVDTLCLNTRTVKAPVTQGVTHCVQGTDLSELTQFVPCSVRRAVTAATNMIRSNTRGAHAGITPCSVQSLLTDPLTILPYLSLCDMSSLCQGMHHTAQQQSLQESVEPARLVRHGNQCQM